jgi:hypothetical protein
MPAPAAPRPSTPAVASLPALGALAFALTGGCGGGQEAAKPAPSIAEALAFESKAAAVAKEADTKREAELKAAAEAKRKAEAELQAAIDAVLVQPAKPPRDLAAACDAEVDAYEQFMRNNRDAGMVTNWFNAKGKNLGERRGVCLKSSVPVAACLTHALAHAPDPLFDRGEDAVTRLQAACADKFGATAAP